MMNFKRLLLIFLCIFIMSINLFCQELSNRLVLNNLESIRGYKFGEKISEVLKKEKSHQEYSLQINSTNENRLVYKGMLFNKKVHLIYLFQDKRLVSLSYFWLLEDLDRIFYKYITDLLSKKYGKGTIKDIPTIGGHFQLDSYAKYIGITNDNTISQKAISIIELESIDITNSIRKNTAYILEFRTYDSDYIIEQDILLDDL